MKIKIFFSIFLFSFLFSRCIDETNYADDPSSAESESEISRALGAVRMNFYDSSGQLLTYSQVRSKMCPTSNSWEADAWIDPVTLKVIKMYPMSGAASTTFNLPQVPAALALNWPTTPQGYGLIIVDNGGNGFSAGTIVNFTIQAALDIKRHLDIALSRRPDYVKSTKFDTAYNDAVNHINTAGNSTSQSTKGAQGQLALDQLAVAYDTLLKEYGPHYALEHKAQTTPMLGFTMETIDNFQADIDKAKTIAGNYAWIRIVFQDAQEPSKYTAAVNYAKSKGVKILGCPVDSTLDSSLTDSQCLEKFKKFIAAFPDIEVWEIGNEVNGGWSSPTIGQRVAGTASYCKSLGKKTYLSLFWQISSGDTGFDMFGWISSHIPQSVRSNLDYVMVSQYQEQAPMGMAFDLMMLRMQKEFPDSKVGLAELGYWISGQRYWWAYDKADPQHGRQLVCEQYYNASLAYANSAGGAFWWNFCYSEWDTTMNGIITTLRNKLDAAPPVPVVQTLFADNFEADNLATIWSCTGNVYRDVYNPKFGNYKVEMIKTSKIVKQISTVGYSDIVLKLYFGVHGMDGASEYGDLQWHDGSSWKVLKRINNGSPELGYLLKYYEFMLPAEANNNANFKIRLQVVGDGNGDITLADNISVKGKK